jgi:hypothetical protein
VHHRSRFAAHVMPLRYLALTVRYSAFQGRKLKPVNVVLGSLDVGLTQVLKLLSRLGARLLKRARIPA